MSTNLAETLIFLSGGVHASLLSGAVFNFDSKAKASLQEIVVVSAHDSGQQYDLVHKHRLNMHNTTVSN
jgi:hypothetical protein